MFMRVFTNPKWLCYCVRTKIIVICCIVVESIFYSLLGWFCLRNDFDCVVAVLRSFYKVRVITGLFLHETRACTIHLLLYLHEY